MKKKNIPEKINFLERIASFIYSILTYIAWFLLILSSIFLVIYFFSFIFKGDIFNKDFIQLCIYLAVGTFLFIFVYDERCKNKILKGKRKTKQLK